MTAVINIIPTVVPSPKTKRYQSAHAGLRMVVRTNNATAAESRQPVDGADDQRPHELIRGEFTEVTVHPAQWRPLGFVRMRFRIVRVSVHVHVFAVSVGMRVLMLSGAYQSTRIHTSHHSCQVHDAQRDQHQPD